MKLMLTFKSYRSKTKSVPPVDEDAAGGMIHMCFLFHMQHNEVRGQGHSDQKMVHDTLLS